MAYTATATNPSLAFSRLMSALGRNQTLTVGLLRPGNEHRHARSIAAVSVAERGDEISLLQLQRDEDIGGGRNCEHEVADAHGGRRPEGDHEAQHDRMAHEAIE